MTPTSEGTTPHPRPALERAAGRWQSLDGWWAFGVGAPSGPGPDAPPALDRRILVPFAPESAASGLALEGFLGTVWYRRELTVPEEWRRAGRVLLHFGAADYRARVWLGDQFLGEHVGGHTPFTFEITGLTGGPLPLTVRVDDDPHAMDQPRGKQDWLEDASHSIWYPRTTGLWQTVWLEHVPEVYIETLEFTPDLTSWSLKLEAELCGPRPAHMRPADLSLRVRLEARGAVLAEDHYRVGSRHLTRTLHLADGGIDQHRQDLLWSPEHPQLIAVTAELWAGGVCLDSVRSTTALREFGWQGGRFFLNGLPYPLRLVLDQGYWPDTLMSGTDEQLRRDVELTRRLGFNGVRKHQKIESPRYLHWCDQIGLLVWTELPSAYAYSDRSVQALTQEWTAAVLRDRGRPCVAAWVPFNESWGVPDLERHPRATHLVQALYHLTRSLDHSRPVLGNDGWETPLGDLIGIHDYAADPETLRRRYATAGAVQDTLARGRPAGRRLLLEGADAQAPVLLTEFGGVAYTPGAEDGWGYSRARTEAEFLAHYAGLLAAANESEGLAGFCYTQLTDTFQERNGLLSAGREPKADLALLSRATRNQGAANLPEDAPLNPLGYAPAWREWCERQAIAPGPSQVSQDIQNEARA